MSVEKPPDAGLVGRSDLHPKLPGMAAELPAGEDALHGDQVILNMGPSHPSTHGVLRLVVTLDGETVRKVVPYVGYLHRGMEKIAEGMTYNQFVPYTDRLDYLAPLSNNVAYIMAVEKLMGITLPPRGRVLRVMACEIARISAHLLWLGTGALDLGAATIFFHLPRARDSLQHHQIAHRRAADDLVVRGSGGSAATRPTAGRRWCATSRSRSPRCSTRSTAAHRQPDLDEADAGSVSSAPRTPSRSA